MAGISIRERSVGDVMILELRGLPLLSEKLGLRDRMAELMTHGTTRFVINLEKTRGWGSLLIGELVSAYMLCQQASCSMKLLKPPERLGAILAISKLDSTFDLFETEEAAIGSFGEPGESPLAA